MALINSLVYVEAITSLGFGRGQDCVMRLELAFTQDYIPRGLLVKPMTTGFLFLKTLF